MNKNEHEREVFIDTFAIKLTFKVEWEDFSDHIPWESVRKPVIIPLTKREAINDIDYGPVMDASSLDVNSIDGLDRLIHEIETEELEF
tara:strand:+ start:2236 stop:2499 length:264 start_codon:yes stop_codon:yes gene_type:complete